MFGDTAFELIEGVGGDARGLFRVLVLVLVYLLIVVVPLGVVRTVASIELYR